MSKTQPPAGFDDLSIAEQIDYVNALWEKITSRPSDVPVPEWHRDVLEDRLKQHRDNPGDVEAWDQVRDKVRNKIRQARK